MNNIPCDFCDQFILQSQNYLIHSVQCKKYNKKCDMF